MRFDDLVRDHLEPGESAGSEAGGNGDIGRVAPPRHHDAPDPGNVVARIERVPAAAEIDLEPGAEIHRSVDRPHADIAEIARAVAGRDVHAAAEGNGEMSEIAADAVPLHEP